MMKEMENSALILTPTIIKEANEIIMTGETKVVTKGQKDISRSTFRIYREITGLCSDY